MLLSSVVIPQIFLMNLRVRVNIQTLTLLTEFDPINHSESELSYFVKNRLKKSKTVFFLGYPIRIKCRTSKQTSSRQTIRDKKKSYRLQRKTGQNVVHFWWNSSSWDKVNWEQIYFIPARVNSLFVFLMLWWSIWI